MVDFEKAKVFVLRELKNLRWQKRKTPLSGVGIVLDIHLSRITKLFGGKEMKRMMLLFMAAVFLLPMAGFAIANDEIPIVPAENAPVMEEVVQTPVVDKAEKKFEKKVDKKNKKKSAKKIAKMSKKKKGEVSVALTE